MPQQKPTYFIIYDWMITELHLKGGAERDIYALLYSLADRSGVAKVSLKYLAERTGYSERGIKKTIVGLVDMNLLGRTRQDHYGVNEYEVIEPKSIVGRFKKDIKTSEQSSPVIVTKSEEQSSPEIAKTSEQSSPEQVNVVPLKMEQSSPDTPYIYNFYNKIYNNFFIINDATEKKEKFFLLEEFFNTFNLYQPMEEVIRFWNYHAQTDWKNARGQKITNKVAAAQFWKPDEKTAKFIPDIIKRILSPVIAALPLEQRICIIAELETATVQENHLILNFTTKTPISIIEDNPKIMKIFAKNVIKQLGQNANVRYNISQKL